MDGNKLDVAHLRHVEKSRQCVLTFVLQIEHAKYGIINEEIRAVRQAKDTVFSLLQHTKAKLINIIKKRNTIKENGNENNDIEIDISLSRDGKEIKGEKACKELLTYNNKLKFGIFKKYFRIIVNAPLVERVTLPAILYTGCPVKPKLKGMYIKRATTKFTWSKSIDKVNWVVVGYNNDYIPTLDDINHYLKVVCIPANENGSGPCVETISQTSVDVFPDILSDTFLSRQAYTSGKLDGKNIRVISYNTLADRYSNSYDSFPYCQPKHLSVDYRKHLISKEILGYNADIICLQEVDCNIYSEYFKEEFRKNGYATTFHRKGNVIPEGLCCFYNKSRFKLVDSKHIVLSRELRTTQVYNDILSIMKQKEVKDLFLKQQTSLHVISLKLKGTNDILVVANTHLYYHHEASHIRLLQIGLILKFIKRWCKMIQSSEQGRLSVIFCGDFNSQPSSGVYHYMTEGNVNNCQEELEKIGFRNAQKILWHNFNFKSACGTPEFTNYTHDFKGCLDYIFVEENNISVKQIVPLPSEEILSQNVAIPSQNFPSDHIALVADLEL